jgi:hypothetical protein
MNIPQRNSPKGAYDVRHKSQPGKLVRRHDGSLFRGGCDELARTGVPQVGVRSGLLHPVPVRLRMCGRYLSSLLGETTCRVSSRIIAACFETLKISVMAAVRVSADVVPAETVLRPRLVIC